MDGGRFIMWGCCKTALLLFICCYRRGCDQKKKHKFFFSFLLLTYYYVLSSVLFGCFKKSELLGCFKKSELRASSIDSQQLHLDFVLFLFCCAACSVHPAATRLFARTTYRLLCQPSWLLEGATNTGYLCFSVFRRIGRC